VALKFDGRFFQRLPEGLTWPPTKEDLRRLYEEERRSAAKIAEMYGLKAANPKSSETLILYHLRKFGVKRRDRAEHIRKVTEEMVDEWVRRYAEGESLKEIAGVEVSNATIWNHLKKRGVILRDKVGAQIEAVSKYGRRPFSGDQVEKAYLVGLRYGDFDVVKHGRGVRARVSTTHPSMASLFESLFSGYGHIHRYPRTAPFTGFEWTLECDLDPSFEFLLSRPGVSDLRKFTDQWLLAFIAGFFDAEGSIYLHEKDRGYAPQITISNTDRAILAFFRVKLDGYHIASSLSESRQDSKRLGYEREGRIWRLEIWQYESVKSFLKVLALRHQEKVDKVRLALEFVYPISDRTNSELVNRWEVLLRRIEEDRNRFIEEARCAVLGTEVI
jgi:hypothetical protein